MNICPICGRSFLPASPRQKYCPDSDCAKTAKKVRNIKYEVRRKIDAILKG